MKTTAIRASVVIPARNCESTLGAVLDALGRQRFPAEELEVIVVDDGSTDRTAELVAQRRPAHALSHLRGEADGSPWRPGRVRNRGLAAATGHVVIFLDADVIPGPDLVGSHVAAHAQERRSQAVLGYLFGYPWDPARRDPAVLRPPPTTEMIDRLPEFLGRAPEDWRDGRELDMELWPDLRGCPWSWNFCYSGNLSVPRDLALACGGFDDDFEGWGGEDTELGFRLHLAGAELRIERRAWGVHYPHPSRPRPHGSAVAGLRRFLRKHGDPRLEVSFWWLLERVRQVEGVPIALEIMTVLADPPRLPGPSIRTARELADSRTAGPAGTTLLLGEWPVDRGEAEPSPSVAYRPFADSTARDSAAEPAVGRFVGLALPHPDQSFADGLLLDYWRCFSPPAIGFIVAEVLRVSRRAVLVETDAAREALVAYGVPRESLGQPPELPDIAVRTERARDAIAHVFTRPGEGSDRAAV